MEIFSKRLEEVLKKEFNNEEIISIEQDTRDAINRYFINYGGDGGNTRAEIIIYFSGSYKVRKY